MTGREMRDRVHLWAEFMPTRYRVKVILTGKSLGGGTAGDTRVVRPKTGSRYFEIRIRRQICPVARYMVLIHEYAHAVSFHVASPLDHLPEWGLAEARLWAYESDSSAPF